MPKQKKTSKQVFAKISRIYPGIFQFSENEEVFCKLCQCVVQARKLFSVEQHCKSNKHRMYTANNSSNGDDATKILEYNFDLSKSFMEANIPLSKIEHPSISALLEKYTEQAQPNLGTLQSKIPKMYKDTMKKLQNIAHGEYIWISISYITDADCRLIANLIFGILNADGVERDKCYLLNALHVNETDEAACLSAFFIDSLSLLWPQGIPHDKVLVCVTGADANMLKAVSKLKGIFPKMLHINCFAQSFHRLGEYVRKCFTDVNNLVSNTNASFLMSPYNRYIFKKNCPKLPLPPNPCITRWCTWLRTAFFYSDNYAELKRVVNEFDDDDAEAIIEAKRLFNDKAKSAKIQNDLNLLKRDFFMLVKGSERVEMRGLTLKEIMTLVENVFNSLASIDQIEYFQKLQTNFYKSDGYNCLLAIHKALYENCDSNQNHPYLQQLTKKELDLFKYCPVNVYQAERSFPLYSQLFNSQLRMLRFDCFKQNLIIYSNNFKD